MLMKKRPVPIVVAVMTATMEMMMRNTFRRMDMPHAPWVKIRQAFPTRDGPADIRHRFAGMTDFFAGIPGLAFYIPLPCGKSGGERPKRQEDFFSG
jgi:hypothetical protein